MSEEKVRLVSLLASVRNHLTAHSVRGGLSPIILKKWSGGRSATRRSDPPQ